MSQLRQAHAVIEAGAHYVLTKLASLARIAESGRAYEAIETTQGRVEIQVCMNTERSDHRIELKVVRRLVGVEQAKTFRCAQPAAVVTIVGEVLGSYGVDPIDNDRTPVVHDFEAYFSRTTDSLDLAKGVLIDVLYRNVHADVAYQLYRHLSVHGAMILPRRHPREQVLTWLIEWVRLGTVRSFIQSIGEDIAILGSSGYDYWYIYVSGNDRHGASVGRFRTADSPDVVSTKFKTCVVDVCRRLSATDSLRYDTGQIDGVEPIEITERLASEESKG